MSDFKKVIDLSKKTRIPDVGERTNNDPCYLMSSNDVLKLLKSIYADGAMTGTGADSPFLDREESGKEVITEYMASGIIKEAVHHYGWSEVKLIGKQLLFIK